MPADRDVEDRSNDNWGIFEFGDAKGLPFLDNTVSGTTRGDGEDEVENGEEHAKRLSFTLAPELALSSLPFGQRRGGVALNTVKIFPFTLVPEPADSSLPFG